MTAPWKATNDVEFEIVQLMQVLGRTRKEVGVHMLIEEHSSSTTRINALNSGATSDLHCRNRIK